MSIANDPTRTTRNEKPDNRADGLATHPDLEWREVIKGSKPGDRFVRIGTHQGFKRVRSGYMIPQEGAGESQGAIARTLRVAKRILIGRPISTALEAHERLTKIKALAIYSSDALSSVA